MQPEKDERETKAASASVMQKDSGSTDKYFDIMHLIGKAKQEQDNINILDLV